VYVLGIETWSVLYPLLKSGAESGRAIRLFIYGAPVREGGLEIAGVVVVGGNCRGERKFRVRQGVLDQVAVTAKAGESDFVVINEAGRYELFRHGFERGLVVICFLRTNSGMENCDGCYGDIAGGQELSGIGWDAAHVHPPDGGQGLQTGVQDAVNLGWKLAHVVKGTSPESLLDTYHAERHPVAARVLRNAMASVALRRPDERTKALRDTISELLSMDEPRRRFAAMMSGLDIHYDLGEGHPLLGRRMPDLDLITDNGPLRVFTLLHDARPVLLNFGEPGGFDITPWADRVQLIDAKYVGTWELPALGAVTAPSAVLIRPDGYVAWVGDLTQSGLADALTTWFGPPGM
jgi:hypothetical protein